MMACSREHLISITPHLFQTNCRLSHPRIFLPLVNNAQLFTRDIVKFERIMTNPQLRREVINIYKGG